MRIVLFVNIRELNYHREITACFIELFICMRVSRTSGKIGTANRATLSK